jgi:hypothetical protein
MSLNEYKNEVKDFMISMKSLNGDNHQKVAWLQEEFEQLQKAVKKSDMKKVEHQIYDMFYLLFEMAADNDFDLDSEWSAGAHRKRVKYLDNK